MTPLPDFKGTPGNIADNVIFALAISGWMVPPCEDCGRLLEYAERWDFDPTICLSCARAAGAEPHYPLVHFADTPPMARWRAFAELQSYLWTFPPIPHNGDMIDVPPIPFRGMELYRLLARSGVLTGWRPPFTHDPGAVTHGEEADPSK